MFAYWWAHLHICRQIDLWLTLESPLTPQMYYTMVKGSFDQIWLTYLGLLKLNYSIFAYLLANLHITLDLWALYSVTSFSPAITHNFCTGIARISMMVMDIRICYATYSFFAYSKTDYWFLIFPLEKSKNFVWETRLIWRFYIS